MHKAAGRPDHSAALIVTDEFRALTQITLRGLGTTSEDGITRLIRVRAKQSWPTHPTRQFQILVVCNHFRFDFVGLLCVTRHRDVTR